MNATIDFGILTNKDQTFFWPSILLIDAEGKEIEFTSTVGWDNSTDAAKGVDSIARFIASILSDPDTQVEDNSDGEFTPIPAPTAAPVEVAV